DTFRVAFLVPAVSFAGGAKRTQTVHDPPGARLWTPVQLDSKEMTENSVAPVIEGVIPVRFTVPVLRSVNVWFGHESMPQPRLVVGLHEVGVKVAAATTPVPLRLPGDPLTTTFPVIVTVPSAAPTTVSRVSGRFPEGRCTATTDSRDSNFAVRARFATLP